MVGTPAPISHEFSSILTYNLSSPARFYVSMIVKMIMVHVIEHYDIKLATEDAKPHFSWGINLVTHPGLTLLIRRKESA